MDGVYDAVQGTLIVVYLPSGISVLYQLTTPNPIIGTTPLNFSSFTSPLVQQFPITLAETNAGAAPANYFYPPGNVLRYGANTTPGVTDMTAPIQAALNQAGQPTGISAYAPAGNYFASGQLTQLANSVFYGDGSASVIISGVATNDAIVSLNTANVTIRDLKVITPAQSGGYVAAIALRGTNNSLIERCEVTGGYFIGIYVTASATQAAVRNRIVGNFIHDTTNVIQDSCDIKLDSTANFGASYNVIDGNQCFGNANWMGISLEASQNPNLGILRNVVTNNRIGTHITYGIILYTHTAGDTYNQVIDNYVEGITGTGLTGSGGTGIYVASMTAVTVANNTVVNCCNASSVQFTQGGITILSGFAGSANVITGNAVYDMAQGNANSIVMAGINIISSPPGTVVTGNLVSQQTGFTGYNGIEVQGGNTGVTITGNTVNILNTIAGTRGILALANGANLQNVTINGNTVYGCSFRGISVEQSGGFATQVFTITGNTASNGVATTIPISVTNASLGAVNGNTCNAATTTALNVSAVTGTSFSGNMLTSTGGTTASLAGVCTGSLFDDSNVINGGVANSATGLQAKQRTAVSPQTLAFASMIGDLSTNTAGATPWGWMCTATGTPGTWTALTLP
jgi:hypothetical protein